MAFSPRRPVAGSEILLSRAEAEVQLADRATDARVEEVHQRLASLLLGKLFEDEPAEKEMPGNPRIENRQALSTAITRLGRILKDEKPDPALERLLDRVL